MSRRIEPHFDGKKLINTLVGDLKPVKPLIDPMLFASLWLFSSIFLCVLGLYFFFPASVNWGWTFSRTDVVIEISLFVVISYLLSIIGLISVRPGWETPSWIRLLLLILVGAVIINFALRWMSWGISTEMVQKIGSKLGEVVTRPEEIHRPACYLEVLYWGLILFVGILYYINRGFGGANRQIASFLGAAAAGLVPALLMSVFCTSEPNHVLRFHLAPILLNLLIVKIWIQAEERMIRSRRHSA